MKTVSSTDLKQSLGDVLAAAAQEPVTITRHGAPRFVLLSIEAYERRKMKDSREAYTLDTAPDDHIDMLIAAVERQLDALKRD
ncbi:type II toxin-antitoxin system Phd/YefM family antitoxin [Tabrizicola sp.]|uniref:type II toxin-antitoxin system Phd/YefM family antitoxin n=1 Tax=Tabrizicola sp. TaxID=2005166 RepID=UPI0035B33C01